VDISATATAAIPREIMKTRNTVTMNDTKNDGCRCAAIVTNLSHVDGRIVPHENKFAHGGTFKHHEF
jgi:hypothetical protein